VAAQSLEYRFYAVHPYNGKANDGKRYLIKFDPGSDPIVADWEAMSYSDGTVPGGTMVTASFSPDGTLYTVIAEGGQGRIATIDSADGTVEDFPDLDPTSDLYGVPGSGILSDGKLYALHKPANSLRIIDLTDGTYESKTLTIDDSWPGYSAGTELLGVYGDYHVGLAVDFDNDRLLGVIGNGSNPYGDNADDELVQIDTDGTVHLIEDDVITELNLIGVETEPCTGKLYAMRGGSALWQVDVTGENSMKVADVTFMESPVTVASLASPYPESVCCDPCPEGFYYKFEWVEDEESEGECAGEFVIYDSEDNMVESVEGLTLTSVECDEDGEPVEACFETSYCDLTYEVKAGSFEEEYGVEYGEFCVTGIDEEKETGGGTKTITHAISNIEFTC
jgi:hypothetical protein